MLNFLVWSRFLTQKRSTLLLKPLLREVFLISGYWPHSTMKSGGARPISALGCRMTEQKPTWIKGEGAMKLSKISRGVPGNRKAVLLDKVAAS